MPDAQLTPVSYVVLGLVAEGATTPYDMKQTAARSVGLAPQQHQLLLAIRGHPGEDGPTIGDVADALLVKEHTASGLVDRTQVLGLVVRVRDPDDHRRVHLRQEEAV